MHRTLAASAILLLVGCGPDPARAPAGPSPVATPSRPTEPVGSGGAFAITLTADSTCTAVPAVARSRSYSAEAVTGSPFIRLSGGTFGESSEPGYSFLWNVISQTASGDVAQWWFSDPPIWEFLGAESYVTIDGAPATLGLETGTLDPKAGEWPFWGRFTYCAKAEPGRLPGCAVPEVSCQSSQHTLTVVRR